MKIAVFYYTQSGQAFHVAKSICRSFEEDPIKFKISYKQILPLQEYPFPWDKDAFFDSFPESRLGIPPSGITPIDLSDVRDANLVVIVGQPWFLSPSLPIQSFFADVQIKAYLRGRKVLLVTVCRNMWLMSSRKIKEQLRESQSQLIGHIVLQDRAHNLVSGVTIIRWLFYGKKEGTFLLPGAGISDNDLKKAFKFGEIINHSLSNGTLDSLQEDLLRNGAINYKPSVLFLEKAGYRMFGIWAKFVRKKGGFRESGRLFRVKLFTLYILFVLFFISPFGQLIFYLTYPIHHVNNNKKIDCSV